MTKLPDDVDGRSKRARQFRQAVADLASDFGGEEALTAADRVRLRIDSALLAVAARVEQLDGEVGRGD